ncbi:BatD family protein [Microbulbifer bruguierae]|uniref:BatD family protein n=1 Tax=Microbulbifer bruguierae TaxID=3029061 RepID=A0ABY8NGB8_9GAMM|nr:BatD family protein [Microbulbifer bruguierae]WGL17652.1 BatD family protein [Microbulbifer bruguierae]
MKRWILSLTFCLFTSTQVVAADTPRIESKLSDDKAVPGQSISLFVTILVPTWMTQPADFPEFDQPNLSVTLPSRSSQAVSQVIDGTTWSGVTREYLIIPLAPGSYRLPAGDIKVAYKNPDGGDDLQTTLKLAPPPIVVSAPQGAEGLNPFIAARDLTLTQEIEGEPEKLRAGDAFSRAVTATIEGSTVMFIPRLLNSRSPEGLAAYADAHKAEDKTDTSTDETTGIRSERVTYVAESGVRGTLPAVTLRWYDLDDGTIKTSSVEAVKVHARGPGPLTGTSLWEKLLILLAAALAIWLLFQWARPKIHALQKQREQRARTSGKRAWQQLQSACAARDYPAVLQALSEYKVHQRASARTLQPALLTLGAAQFRQVSTDTNLDAAWQQLAQAIDALKPAAIHHRQTALPPLNP